MKYFFKNYLGRYLLIFTFHYSFLVFTNIVMKYNSLHFNTQIIDLKSTYYDVKKEFNLTIQNIK